MLQRFFDEIFQLEFFVLWANYVTLCTMFTVEYQLFMYSMRKILVILKWFVDYKDKQEHTMH